MIIRFRRLTVLAALVIAASAASAVTPAAAQNLPAAAPPPVADSETASAAATTTATTSTKDVGDLWRHLRHKPQSSEQIAASQSPKKPFFFLSPSISSKPSTGFSAGVASSVVFVAGDAATTRISSGDWSVSDSVKGQAGTGMRFRIFTPDNRWFLQGDNRLAWSSLNTYTLGIVSNATPEKLKYNRFRIYDTAFRQVKPRVFAGVGLNINEHGDIRAGSGTDAAFDRSAYVAYTKHHGFPLDRQLSSGTNVGMFVDTRDNAINASKGWLAAATYRTFFDGFLGGNATWQLLEADVRTYKTLDQAGRHKLAFWTLGEFVTGGVAPYLDLPAIADDTYGRSGRGYTSGRYRGPHLLYGEVEYRVTLTSNGFFGAVGFANATAIDGEGSNQQLLGTLAPAAGGGLRVLLSKRSKANFCVDYGWGREGSRGLYLAVRETF